MLPIAQDGAPAKFALMAACIGLGLLHTVVARPPSSVKAEVAAHTTGHNLNRRHAETEAIYWEARALADEQRQQLPSSVLAATQTLLDGPGLTRVWDYYTPDYNCPLLKQRVGRVGDGGKWLCGLRSSMLQTPGCLVYSIGSNGDTNFEEAMLNSTACDVHTFDPTLGPQAMAAVQRVVVGSKDKLHFHPVGVGNPEVHKTLLMNLDKLEKLEDIMTRLQHTWIDVLKMDIEGFEWELFQDFYASGAKLRATQVLIEFHFPGSTKMVWEVFDLLHADNYRIFSVEPNYYCDKGACAKNLLEFAFIKVSDHGQICAPKRGLAVDLDAELIAEAC